MAVNDEHKSLVINQDETIEVFFNQSGTDTTVSPFKWFFNLSDPAQAWFVKADKAIQILQLNSHSTKSAMMITANGSHDEEIKSFKHPKREQVKIKATADATNVEIFGRI